ncbi:HK97-gp10 family putative phage morphogenesis protein [Lactobacillus amylolyticus]|uniref:HK97-gp10 family putative phage morphogenesis protein n=1 Tax=Lactobacillus amylolyticus TaxID=83683 RepID=UPI002492E2B8|nr:HK97-gp10 family putative phage morphogenesis protein [Lactobacillus amylolyticus]
MADLSSQLNDWLENVAKLVPDTQTKAAMTEAGAKVFAEHLKNVTPRSKDNDTKYGHLADNVTYQKSDIDGENNGNSTVGFGKKAYIARFLNDGTKKMKATHFVDNARHESEEAVFTAEKAVYDSLNGGGS